MTPEEITQLKQIVQSFYDPVRTRIEQFKKAYPEATIDPYITKLVYRTSANRTVPSTTDPVYKQLTDSVAGLSDDLLGKVLSYDWSGSIGNTGKMMKAFGVVKPLLKGTSLSSLMKWGNGFTFGEGGSLNYLNYINM